MTNLKYKSISHVSQIENIYSQIKFNSDENIVHKKHINTTLSGLQISFFNECFDKNRIKLLVSWSLQNCGQNLTIDLIESLKNLGFSYATRAGISLGIDDLRIPPTKNILIATAEQNIKKTQINYKQEYLTGIEKFQHLIDTWHRTSEILKQDVISHFKITDVLNPVYMMAFSGARGNVSQVRQLVGMRGLMSDHQGQILDFPIKSNFREGITLTEYIISCYGARKGLVDTALKTANSGYLTRRLVDVCHHIIVCDIDCKTQRGVILSDILENKKVIVPLQNRLIGRILAENIYSSTSIINNSEKPRTALRVTSLKNFENSKTSLLASFLQESNLCKFALFFSGAARKGNFLVKHNDEGTKKNTSQFKLPITLSIKNNTYYIRNTEQLTRLILVQITLILNLLTINYHQFVVLYNLFIKYHRQVIKNNSSQFELPITSFNYITNIKQQSELILFLNLIINHEKKNQCAKGTFYSVHGKKIKKIVAKKNQEISIQLALKIASLKKSVLVRSPLTCEIKNSICQLCYGWSLAHGKLVSLGEAVGVIAAQSIGEPGTQLTMRTFHTGGVFSGDIMNEITAPFSGKVVFSDFLEGMLIRTPHGKIAFLTKVQGSFVLEASDPKPTFSNIDNNNNLQENSKNAEPSALHFKNTAPSGLSGYFAENTTVFQIPALTILFVRNYQHVNKQQVIAEFSSMSTDANQRIQASRDLNTEIEGEVFFQNVLMETITEEGKILSRTTLRLGSIWILSGKIYQQPIPVDLFSQPGDLVDKYSIMAQYETMSPYNGFILGSNKKKTDREHFKNAEPSGLSSGKKKKLNFKRQPTAKTSKLVSNTSHLSLKNPSQNQLEDNTNWLNFPLISYSVESIQYKRIGYFFYAFNNKKFELSGLNAKSHILSEHQLFLSNSLQQEFKNSNNLNKKFFFQSFPRQYQTKTGGQLIYDNFYLNKKIYFGEVFWISEETALVSSENSYINFINYLTKTFRNKRNLSYSKQNMKKITNKENFKNFFYNSQGKFCLFSSNLYGYTQSGFSKKTFSVKKNRKNGFFSKKKKFNFFNEVARKGKGVSSFPPQPTNFNSSRSSTSVFTKINLQFYLKKRLRKTNSSPINKATVLLEKKIKSILCKKTVVLNAERCKVEPGFEFQDFLLKTEVACQPKKKHRVRTQSVEYLKITKSITPELAIKNRKKYSFSYKFHKLNFKLNPYTEFFPICNHSVVIKNLMKKRKLHIVFTNKNQETITPLHEKIFLQSKQDSSYQTKKINFKSNKTFSVKNNFFNEIEKKKPVPRGYSPVGPRFFLTQRVQGKGKKELTPQLAENIRKQILLKTYFYNAKKNQKTRKNGFLKHPEGTASSVFSGCFAVNTKLLTKQRSIFLQPQFPWKYFFKQNQETSLSLKSCFVYNEKEKKFLTKSSFKALQDFIVSFKTSEKAKKLISKTKNSTHASKTSNSLRSNKLAEKTHVPKTIVNRKKIIHGKSIGDFKKVKQVNYLKHKIKPGWVYFPQTSSQVIFKHKKIIKPGEICFNNLLFDQYPIYYECIPVNQIYIKKTQGCFAEPSIVKKNNNLHKQTGFLKICQKFKIGPKSEKLDSSGAVVKNLHSDTNFTSKNNQNKAFKTTKKVNFKVNKSTIVSLFSNKVGLENSLPEKKYLQILLVRTSSSSFFNNNRKFFQFVKKIDKKTLILVYKTILLKKYLKKNFLLNSICSVDVSIKKSKKTRILKKIQPLAAFRAASLLKQINLNKIYFLKNANFQNTKYRRTKNNIYKHSIGTSILKPFRAASLPRQQNFSIKNNQELKLSTAFIDNTIFNSQSSILCFRINNNVHFSARGKAKLHPGIPLFSFENNNISNADKKFQNLQRLKVSEMKNSTSCGEFFILISKVKSYSFSSVPQYKKLLSKKNKVLPLKPLFIKKSEQFSFTQGALKKNSKTIFNYAANFMQLWANNKQSITHLFFNSPAPDFYVKFSFKHEYRKQILFSKSINFFQYYIKFILPKNYKHNISKISFISKHTSNQLSEAKLHQLPNASFQYKLPDSSNQSDFCMLNDSGQALVKESDIFKLKQNIEINPHIRKNIANSILTHVFNVSTFLELQFDSSTFLSNPGNIFNMKHNFKPNQTKFFSSKNYISPEIPLRYTNVLSSCDGEILDNGFDYNTVKKPKAGSLFKKDSLTSDSSVNITKTPFRAASLQKCLILTCNDQVTFFIVSDKNSKQPDSNLKKTPFRAASLQKKLKVENKALTAKANEVKNTKPFEPLPSNQSIIKKNLYPEDTAPSVFSNCKKTRKGKGGSSFPPQRTAKKNNNITLFLGKNIRCGTRINHDFVIPVTGTIIQIEKSKITVRKAQPILFSSKGLISVYHGNIIEKNTLVLRLFYQRLKTGDIIQGIPKIEQLFEARKSNQGALLSGSLHEQLGKIFSYYTNIFDSSDAARFSLEKIQQIIVNSVEKVYRSQGVTISDKHLEIIVRQMTSKVQIIQSGQTNLLPGEMVDLDWIELVNEGLKEKSRQAIYIPVILGITRKSLETKSFISEASFQETTRVLAKSSIERRTDFLKGLKENVVLGNLVPAGTGFYDVTTFHKNDFSPIKLEDYETEMYETYTIFREIFFLTPPDSE